MACSYKFNGEEFSNKQQLTEYIKNNIDAIPNDIMLELLDTDSESALFAESEAKLFSGSEFTNISNEGFSSMEEPITYEYVKGLIEKERNAKLKSLAPRLTDFANKLGVSLEFLQEDGINGVARIADGVVAISLGEDMTDVYYEEMSHMLRERFNNRLSNEELSEFVKSSPEYAKYSDEYRMVYQSEGLNNEELERKVNLEIFDKILASELKSELTGAPISTEKQGGLWETIRQWVRDFIDWTRNTGGKDARNMIRDIVRAVNAQDIAKFSNQNFEFQSYYSLDSNISPELKSLQNDLIANLKNSIASIRAAHGSESVVNLVENQIYGFGEGDALATNSMLDSFINQTAKILSDIDREVGMLATDKSIFNRTDLALMNFFANVVPEVLPLTKKNIVNGNLLGGNTDAAKRIMANKVDELDVNVKKIKAKYDEYALDFSLKTIESEQNLIGTSKDVIDQMKSALQNGVAKDVGYMQRWLFSEYSSSSVVAGLFYKLRHDMENNYRNRTNDAIAEIYSKLGELGITIEQFNTLIDRGKDGKPTGYVISPYMRDVLSSIEIDMIASEIDPKILDRSAIQDIMIGNTKISELTDEQRELYRYAANKANNEMTEKPFIDEYYQERDAEMDANIRSVFPNKTDEEVRKLKKAIAVKTSPLYSKKAKILSKYIRKSIEETRLDILNMSYNDVLEIDSLDAQLKSLSQTYSGLGSEKEGEAEEISKVLQYSMENYKAQESESDYISEYSDYLDGFVKYDENGRLLEEAELYQILKRTGSIIFNEEDSINTALHELGDYKIFSDNAIIQMINAYLPKDKKLKISTPSFNSSKGIANESITNEENQRVKNAISTLKEIRKSMTSPYKKFGELRIGEGGLSGTMLSEIERIDEILDLIKSTQKLKDEEKALIKDQEIGFIPTDNFYKDYGYVDVGEANSEEEANDLIKSMPIRIDENEKVRELRYVTTNKDGEKEYWKISNRGSGFKGAGETLQIDIIKLFPGSMGLSNAELIRKEEFERTHMKTLGKSGKLVPKSYYMKVVNERNVQYFDSDNPVYGAKNPQEKVIYISKVDGKHYQYSEEKGNYIEMTPPDKKKGERFVKFGGKTFLVNIKPNSLWRGKSDASKYINPNYNESIGKKAKQYKKAINVNGKPTPTLNDEYFSKFGISKDSIWGEATANVNLFKAMQLVLNNDYELLRSINVEQDYFWRPQVRTTPDELLYTKGSIKNASLAWVSRNVLSNIQDVDELGTVNTDKRISIKEGKQRNQLVDNYNAKIDTEELTNNLLSSYYVRTEMAIRYDERAKNLSKADMLMNMAKEIEYSIDDSNTEKGLNSNVLASMKDNYVSDFFGAIQAEIGTIRVGDKMISLTKTLNTARRLITCKTLGFNMYTGISSAMSGWMARVKESFVGQYGTRADYKFASDTISYIDMAKDIGSNISSEKILRIAEYMGIVDIKDIMARAGRNKNFNIISSIANPYSFLVLGDMPRIAESVIIGLLQYRKIDNKWMSRDNFLEQTVNKDKKTMSEANAIWDANQKNALYHEVMKYYNEETKTLKIPPKETTIKKLFDNASGIGKKHHTDLTGNVKSGDSANAFRKPLAAPLGMYKNFFINVLQNRFHEGTPGNSFTGGQRKGSYRYVQMNREWVKLLSYAILNLQSKINDPNNGLTYQEMQALRRIQMDTYMALAFLTIAMLVSALADDDEYEDNWIVQSAAFSAVKTFQEVSGGDIYSIPFQGWEVLKSPYRSFETLATDVKNLVVGGEETTRGSFKGWDKRAEAALKLSPMGLANIYKLIGDDAAYSRNFATKDSWLWNLYEKVSEE